jgi:hypothetical protein
MKTSIFIVYIFSAAALMAAVPMARVVAVTDSRTIVVAVQGRQTTVTLSELSVPKTEEPAAIEYLHRLLDGAWVYVEDGNVYRSPDGLYVNGEMQRRAWRSSSNMRYLGIADPGPRAVKQPSPGKAASPSGSRRRAPARGSAAPPPR